MNPDTQQIGRAVNIALPAITRNDFLQ